MNTMNQKRQREPVVMSMVNDQCVWSRAGVIKPVKCINAFDCLGCTTDQGCSPISMKNEGLPAKTTKAVQNAASHEPGQMPAYAKRSHFGRALLIRL